MFESNNLVSGDNSLQQNVFAHVTSVLSHLESLSSNHEPEPEPTTNNAHVHVVGGDTMLREQIQIMLRGIGQIHVSNSETVATDDFDGQGCIVLASSCESSRDLEWVEKLAETGAALPIVYATDVNDAETCRRVFRAGVFDFVRMPEDYILGANMLCARVVQAIRFDAELRNVRTRRKQLSDRMGQLTPRESEVLHLLVQGKSTKQIAMQFEISIQTAAKHRAAVLAKMKVENDVELVLAFLSLR